MSFTGRDAGSPARSPVDDDRGGPFTRKLAGSPGAEGAGGDAGRAGPAVPERRRAALCSGRRCWPNLVLVESLVENVSVNKHRWVRTHPAARRSRPAGAGRL